jgi:hypothetical protein
MWIKYLLALLIGFGLINSSYGKLSLSQYVASVQCEKKLFFIPLIRCGEGDKAQIILIASTNEKRIEISSRFSDEKQKISTQVVETNEKHRKRRTREKMFCAQYCHKDIYVHSHCSSTLYKRKIETEYKKVIQCKNIFFSRTFYISF